MDRLNTLLGRAEAKPGSSKRLQARKAPTTSLEFWRTSDASTHQGRNLWHESVFAAIPCRGSLVDQADWCAVGTVAGCEAALLLVVGTVRAGARVI